MHPIIYHFIAGSIMGVAGMIPGVSSGTIAVITDSYHDIVTSIDHICKRKENRRPHILCLINIFSGVLLTTFLFAGVMDWALTHYPKYIQLFFSGLMIGTLPLIYSKTQIQAKRARYI